MTYTFVELAISPAAYDEIAQRLGDAEYHHCFGHDNDAIDMRGIAVVKSKEVPPVVINTTVHDHRVTELLQANNALLERARNAERERDEAMEAMRAVVTLAAKSFECGDAK